MQTFFAEKKFARVGRKKFAIIMAARFSAIQEEEREEEMVNKKS